MNPQPRGKPILCLDFDGVIHSYKSGWQGVGTCNDPPVPGVFEWIRRAIQYFDIHVYSSRCTEMEGRWAIREYFRRYAEDLINVDVSDKDGPVITITDEKPRAFLQIDDRCVRFDGDWTDPQFDPAKLREFKSWYQSQK